MQNQTRWMVQMDNPSSAKNDIQFQIDINYNETL